MPERHGPDGRPNGHAPGASPGAPSGASSGRAPQPTALDALLAAAVRADAIDPEAEGRALAAFRAARDEGLLGAQAHTRRRDDWRPEKARRSAWSLRATLAALLASVTLGGVAVAAIGSGGGAEDERRGPQQTSSAPDRAPRDAVATSAPGSSASGRGEGPSDRPSSAQDTEAQCRAYDSVKGRGQALDATAWQRLVRAAGGEENVEKYCAEQLTEKPGQTDPEVGNPEVGNPEAGNPEVGKPSTSAKPSASARPSASAKPSEAPGMGSTQNNAR
ncbi:hypothetical protein [Streptomyces sp. 2A115]|uniref:hypothetical protein n=1 Tax=Streptomyces sp. 2A115 TaxID=3457439 RepID=UPI003FD46788